MNLIDITTCSADAIEAILAAKSGGDDIAGAAAAAEAVDGPTGWTSAEERRYQATRRCFANADLPWTRDDERNQNREVARRTKGEVAKIRHRINVEINGPNA
jgi:hypothetical protein